MNLKGILSKKDKESFEYFFSIAVEPGWVQSSVWRVVDGKVQIISTSVPMAWELEEELISQTDASLSTSTQKFPEDTKEPEKTVFGVIPSWVESGEIKGNYLGTIKKICTKLSLKPVGFVVLPEAVAHFTKFEEGSPLSAVAVGVYSKNLDVSLFKLGNMIGTNTVARSVSVVEDVAEGLARFDEKNLPSRFILYDGKEGELEEVRQALIKASWEDVDGVVFLHTPKVEILDSERKISAISLAGASELGDVAKIEMSKERDEMSTTVTEKSNVIPADGTLSAEEVGFALGTDVAKVEQDKEKGIDESEIDDVKSEHLEKPVEEETPVVKQRVEIRKSKVGIPLRIPSFLSKFKFPTRKKESEFAPHEKHDLGKKAVLFGGGLLIILLIGGFASWWFLPKANVTLYLSTKKLEDKIDISVDPNASEADLKNKVLPGELLSTSVSGEKTASTTGTKIVGERAKGELTIYRVGSSLDLDAGIEISGPGGLTFTLDGDISVASGSAITAGTTTASVTASDIGAEYNLASGTTFNVGNYTQADLGAKNEGSFSGGTSKDISAVSQEDRDNLEEDLTDELKEKAKGKLKQQVDNSMFYIDESLSSTVVSKEFSNKVDDEAETLKLILDLGASAIVVDKNALVDLAKMAVEDQVPDGFTLRGDQIDIEFELEDEEDGVYRLTASVIVNLLPEVDIDGLVGEIAGKYPLLAKEYLNSQIPGFSGAEITLKPKLPGRLGRLPQVKKNIEVEVSAER